MQIARQHQPHGAVVADILDLPHPNDLFDFAISIAVIHHLSSRTRRIQAIKEVLKILRPPSNPQCSNSLGGGQGLIFVWALEQKDSRRGWDRGHKQDVLVPWVLKQHHASKSRSSPESMPMTYHRYYHLYHEGELQQDVIAAGGTIVKSGFDRDNWWVIIARRT